MHGASTSDKRQDAQIAKAMANGQTGVGGLATLVALLGNRVQPGTPSAAGPTANVTLPVITPTPGVVAPKFRVTAQAVTVTASTPGDQISGQLRRAAGDGSGPVVIGPLQGPFTTDAAGKASVEFDMVDNPGDALPHVYSLLLTNVTGGGHTVVATTSWMIAQQVPG